MDNFIILHSTPISEFRKMIGEIIEEKLKQFKLSPQVAVPQKAEYLSRREVCVLLKISLATLYYYTKDGILNGYRIGGRVLYKSAEVEQSVQAIQTTKYKHGRQ